MRDYEQTVRRWKTAGVILAALALYALPSTALLAASHDSNPQWNGWCQGHVTLSVNGHHDVDLMR